MRKGLRLLLFLPAILVLVLAIPRLITGLAVDEVFPVPDGIVSNQIFSPARYRQTAAVLSVADSKDGQTQVMRAAALRLSGAPADQVMPVISEALQQSPASVQGWMLLTETLERIDQARAVVALDTVLEMSPFDYWLIIHKARAGALLWKRLDPEARQQVLIQTRLLWTRPELRSLIPSLLSVPGGASLMTTAIQDPEQIRAINRFVRQQQLGLR